MLANIKTTHHISSYDDYDALMYRLTGKLRTFDAPRNQIEMEYDVGDENDHLDYAWGKDGIYLTWTLTEGCGTIL